jgi:hypothetical protein
VSLAFPEGKRITKARALRAARDLQCSREGGRLQFEIASMEDYEVIALT